MPGALLLLASGAWLITAFHGGWDFLRTPWLAGMVVLFALEFIEGNTVTRLYFLRLRRLTRAAMQTGGFTEDLKRARAEQVASFTHFLDLPVLLLIVSLGAFIETVYNRQRLHSALDYLTPEEYEATLPPLRPGRAPAATASFNPICP